MHGACCVVLIRPPSRPLAHGGEPLGAIGGRPHAIPFPSHLVVGVGKAKQRLQLHSRQQLERRRERVRLQSV
jgi:hypothetical protein